MSRVGPRWWHSRGPVIRTGPRKGDKEWHPGVRYHRERKPTPNKRLTVTLWARKPEVFRALLLERQGGLCGICDEPASVDEANIDHIVPVSRGGPTALVNLRATHIECNAWRSNHECMWEPNIALVLETGLADDTLWLDWVRPSDGV